MSQQAIQEVPSTPQLGTLLMQQNEGFNQRVPSQEYYSQDDGEYCFLYHIYYYSPLWCVWSDCKINCSVTQKLMKKTEKGLI